MKAVAALIKKKKEVIDAMYHSLDEKEPHPLVKRGLDLCELRDTKQARVAILRRLIELKEDSLVEEFEKHRFSKESQDEKKDLMYTLVASLYEVEHAELIAELRQRAYLSEFLLAVCEGMHKLGVIMNAFTRSWQSNIIVKNHSYLKDDFKDLAAALAFFDEKQMYQKNERGEKGDRTYGGLIKFGSSWSLKPYALLFADYVLRLDFEFDNLILNLKRLRKDSQDDAYIRYFELLRAAFNEKDNDKCIPAWQALEFAWMDIKGPLQIGHPLEYYEDPYAKSVALEWDIRIEDDYPFNKQSFEAKIKQSFENIYKSIAANDEAMFKKVNDSIDKTQCYICLPATFYGADLNGLFSAQVVPNDEFVSQKTGKKIFAFLNHVYNSYKAKPFMKLSKLVLPLDFLNYTRELLFFKEAEWKKVYEISTIGHEYGHILFVGSNSEQKMNIQGEYKNIEEFKATMGGLVAFFLHEEEKYIKPVFSDFIKRAIGLIAWQKVLDVQPYYCEGLIELDLLFKSEALVFEAGVLSVNLDRYEEFKTLAIKRYKELARHYVDKKDAALFLYSFVSKKDGVYLPIDEKVLEFVNYYYDLHLRFGNEVDEDDEKLKSYYLGGKS